MWITIQKDASQIKSIFNLIPIFVFLTYTKNVPQIYILKVMEIYYIMLKVQISLEYTKNSLH